jgi:hypothetical protein
MGTDSPGAVGSIRSPLDVAEATFQLLACEPGGLTFDCTGLHAELPQRAVGLVELRDLLCEHRLSREALDSVWRELVIRARRDGASWMIGAVGMALPALRATAGRLTRGYFAGDPHDLDTELMTGFLQALRTTDLDRPHLRPRLCDAARRGAQRARRTAESGVWRPLPLRASAVPKPPWNHPDFVLGDAVAKGVVNELDAELIGRTRLEELSLAQAAAELGLTTEAAKKRRQRAEPVLCQAIQAGEVHSRLSLTISPAATRSVGAPFSVRSRDTSDTRPEITEPKGGWGTLPGSARAFLPTFAATHLYPCGRPARLPRRSRPRRRWPRRIGVVMAALLLVLLICATAAHAGTLAKPRSLEEVIKNLRNWLLGFLVALATLMATIGGLRYLLAGGDPGEVAKAKNTLKFAAFGYAIAALAPLLVAALQSIVGV